MWRHALGSSGSGEGPQTDTCEHSNHRVPRHAGNFLTRLGTISFSRRNLFYGVTTITTWYSTVAGSCEHRNESSLFMKGRKFLTTWIRKTASWG